MARIRKFLSVTLTGISGLLLTLAGFNLIELSKSLILYAGVILLAAALITYIIPDGQREEKKEVL